MMALAGQLVVFSGRLSSLGRKDARALVTRLGGDTAEDVTAKTTMVVVGEAQPTPALAADTADDAGLADKSRKLKRAEELNALIPGSISIVSEADFCRLTGLPTPADLKRRYHAMRDLLVRYRALREDHLRYLVKCGLLQPVLRTNADVFFGFGDLATVRQANEDLEAGASFKTVVRNLIASRHGQLSFDFRLDASPAKIITLRRTLRPKSPVEPAGVPDPALAEHYFRTASALDDGSEATRDEAAGLYRKALENDPYLVPALINLANLHYSRDELIEAQALYERAISLEPDFFEAHFNLGNIYHDLGRFAEAQACYREALRLNPQYADAHFYLAVTFEKMGHSADARPHWRAYQQLAPNGEWVELAKEFSD